MEQLSPGTEVLCPHFAFCWTLFQLVLRHQRARESPRKVHELIAEPPPSSISPHFCFYCTFLVFSVLSGLFCPFPSIGNSEKQEQERIIIGSFCSEGPTNPDKGKILKLKVKRFLNLFTLETWVNAQSFQLASFTELFSSLSTPNNFKMHSRTPGSDCFYLISWYELKNPVSNLNICSFYT